MGKFPDTKSERQSLLQLVIVGCVWTFWFNLVEAVTVLLDETKQLSVFRTGPVQSTLQMPVSPRRVIGWFNLAFHSDISTTPRFLKMKTSNYLVISGSPSNTYLSQDKMESWCRWLMNGAQQEEALTYERREQTRWRWQRKTMQIRSSQSMPRIEELQQEITEQGTRRHVHAFFVSKELYLGKFSGSFQFVINIIALQPPCWDQYVQCFVGWRCTPSWLFLALCFEQCPESLVTLSVITLMARFFPFRTLLSSKVRPLSWKEFGTVSCWPYFLTNS